MENIKNICLLGDGNVGKSSIKSRYFFDRYNENIVPTIYDTLTTKKLIDNKTINIRILDTSGQEEYQIIRNNNIIECDSFLLIFSLTSKNSLEELHVILDDIIRIKNKKNICMILVGNKCDLKSEIIITKNDIQKLADKWECKYYETSAKLNINISELFEDIFRQTLELEEKQEKKKKKKICTLL
jgi:small GTP-binding protein